MIPLCISDGSGSVISMTLDFIFSFAKLTFNADC